MGLEQVLANLLEANNIIVFVVLILVFLVGYKVLQTIVQLLMVAGVSGAFLLTMSYLGLGPNASFANTVVFMALGTGLYILYSSLHSLKNFLGKAFKGLKKMFKSSKGESKEKKVILANVDKDE